jgi:hypothetical protein
MWIAWHADVDVAGINEAMGKYGQTGWTIWAHRLPEQAWQVVDDAVNKLVGGRISRFDLAVDWAGDYEERVVRHEWIAMHTLLKHRRRTNSMFFFGEEIYGIGGTVYWVDYEGRKGSAATEMVLYSHRAKRNHLELRHHRPSSLGDGPKHPIQVKELLRINPSEHFGGRKGKIKLAALDVDKLRKQIKWAERGRLRNDASARPVDWKREKTWLEKIQDVEVQKIHDRHPDWTLKSIPLSTLQLPESIIFPAPSKLEVGK